MDTRRLLDEPFTFTQYRPLLPRQFIDEAKKCGLWLSEQELEALHRMRLLVPFYRLARDGREIATAHRRGEDAYHLAHWQPTSRADLTDARTHDRLHNAASEPAPRRLRRRRNRARPVPARDGTARRADRGRLHRGRGRRRRRPRPLAGEVVRVEVELRDGRIVAAPLHDAPAELDAAVTFFIVRLPLPARASTETGRCGRTVPTPATGR